MIAEFLSELEPCALPLLWGLGEEQGRYSSGPKTPFYGLEEPSSRRWILAGEPSEGAFNLTRDGRFQK